MKKKPLLIYMNPKTSGVKEFHLSISKIVLISVLTILVVGLTLKYSVDFIVDFSQNSKISTLKKENDLLKTELKGIAEQITTLRSSIDHIEQRDDQIRTMLDLPAINSDVRQVGIGGADPDVSSLLSSTELSFGSELFDNLNLLKKLEREIRLEKESYQKLLTTVERRQDSLRYLPALKPVRNAYISSPFGNRIHPIRKRLHFHKGIDLATNRGTPIIAPADGTIVMAGRNAGYGLFISIDHKYGYETSYGHLRKIYVRKGQRVKRGDKIGEVGSTGLATSSHLHYEVRFDGKPLNPMDFFLDDESHY